MPMGLTGWRDYLAATEPWCNDPPRMRTYMAAALHHEQIGDHEKAEHYLSRAIAEEEKGGP